MARLDLWFRLFHHASLGLASVCLLYAEAFFLPGPLLLVLYAVAGFQLFAFGADGRRWVLPAWAANVLAGAVAGGGAVWVAVQLADPESVLSNLPLPAGLLPYVGPMLIGLLVIKLFRPRGPRDFWLLQGVGALQVALACVLATNPESGVLFGLLLAAYLAGALGCITLHHFREEQKGEGAEAPAAARLPFARLMAPFCLRWVLAVAALAIPLFLLTPRFDGPSWDTGALSSAGPRPPSQAGLVGFSQAIDLNRDGPVRLSGDEVFRVTTTGPEGGAARPLPADQHWRGGVLDTYRRGIWSNQEEAESPPLPGRSPSQPGPELGPGMIALDFAVAPYAGGFFLAEPVRVGRGVAWPTRVRGLEPKRGGPLVVSSHSPVLPLLYNGIHEYHYRQITYADAPPDRLPADDANVFYRERLTRHDVPGLADWTAALLARLAADPASGLTPADAPDAGGANAAQALPPEAWERVGRALERHLSRSGEYGYTLDLRRDDGSLDPVMDFLTNVKAGHCERFASALALMLRSQGVPARVVVGFRGADDQGNGVYVVRQNQAHAWVEMLAPGPGGAPQHVNAEWLALDPTPAGEAPAAPFSVWDWWRDGQRTGQELWGGLVVNYSADEQAGLWSALQSPHALTLLVGTGLALPAFVGAATLGWVVLRRWGRARRADPAVAASALAGYARLLTLMARRVGLRPRVGQTPREFAAEARGLLLSRPETAGFAHLPDQIVDLLYRVRFGGEPAAEGESAAFGARLDRLAHLLSPALFLAGRKA